MEEVNRKQVSTASSLRAQATKRAGSNLKQQADEL